MPTVWKAVCQAIFYTPHCTSWQAVFNAVFSTPLGKWLGQPFYLKCCYELLLEVLIDSDHEYLEVLKSFYVGLKFWEVLDTRETLPKFLQNLTLSHFSCFCSGDFCNNMWSSENRS